MHEIDEWARYDDTVFFTDYDRMNPVTKMKVIEKLLRKSKSQKKEDKKKEGVM